jgi:hypothetical protein
MFQAKLNFNKSKKDKVKREKDLKVSLQSYVEENYGKSSNSNNDDEYTNLLFSNTASPVVERRGRKRNAQEERSSSTIPLIERRNDDERGRGRGLIEEKETVKGEEVEEEAEEKEDLWALWNKVATHKIANKGKPVPEEKDDSRAPQQKAYQSIKFGNKRSHRQSSDNDEPLTGGRIYTESQEQHQRNNQWSGRNAEKTTVPSAQSPNRSLPPEVINFIVFWLFLPSFLLSYLELFN